MLATDQNFLATLSIELCYSIVLPFPLESLYLPSKRDYANGDDM